ncbi:MAG: hypothetical protein RBT74_10610 [Tenuifilaceae bacterium]|jgi:hypothetical protein|nr:hypothetical protein [Tenuifilaceae bacterium]
MDIGIVLSITVGILSLLVMLLIGWQIYTTINFRQKLKEVEKVKGLMISEINRSQCLTSKAVADFYYSQLVNEPVQNKEFNYLNYMLAALLHSSKNGYFTTCGGLVSQLLETVQPSLKVSQYNKQLLTDLLLAVEAQRSIQGYRELVKLILNLETYD